MAMGPRTNIETATWKRPEQGPVFMSTTDRDFEYSGQIGWQSNGGIHRGNSARTYPFSIDFPLNPDWKLSRVHVAGVWALFADGEPALTAGGQFQLLGADGEVLWRLDLVNGRHYSNPIHPSAIEVLNGDGSSRVTIGSSQIGSVHARVDLLSIDVPLDVQGDVLRLKDLGTPASFVVFDVFFEVERATNCPFHSKSGGIALGEIASIVRVGDRVKFAKAMEQVDVSIATALDLDEARGHALTFLAVVTAAMLEMGGSRSMHRVQLDAARRLDAVDTVEGIVATAHHFVEVVASSLFQDATSPSAYLVDRALAIVDRNFARNLTDVSVASQLGLSTSHFRFLFKEATGQPFHKYLVSMRLEKARQILVEQDIAVSQVAKSVGFTGLSHFSRAFTQRFSVSPTLVRRGAV